MSISNFQLAIAGVAIFMLCGCARTDTSPPPQEDMDIMVDFSEVHRCSRISPEITVTNPPPGTKYYDVRLVEEGKKDRYLGGGTWEEDGTGIIPEGSLTRHYTGPCPASNEETTFIYVVSAMNSPDGQPLEVRLHRFKIK